MMKQRSVILCGTKRGCCPVMTLKDDENIEIKDDYGNTVKMKLEQAKLIGDKLSELIKDDKSG